MINPSEIDLLALPSLHLDDKKHLPQCPGVYFAIDSNDKVQYIGISQDIKARWSQHHRENQLNGIGQIKIAYLEISELDMLRDVETALINWFTPPLNNSRVHRIKELQYSAASIDAMPADRSCPDPECTGKLHHRGKGRSPVCNMCGWRSALPRGRTRKNADRLVSDRDVYQAKKTAIDRSVTYALFDPLLVPEGSIGFIHRSALVDVVVGCSRVSVERDRPGLKAVPIGSLRIKEKRWVEQYKNENQGEQ